MRVMEMSVKCILQEKILGLARVNMGWSLLPETVYIIVLVLRIV